MVFGNKAFFVFVYALSTQSSQTIVENSILSSDAQESELSLQLSILSEAFENTSFEVLVEDGVHVVLHGILALSHLRVVE